MNAILSILVCFAMLFSGGAALPAQPETATTWTLRNLSVTTDEGSVTLTPELRLTGALGSEAALMQFEVVNGDDVLLPMAGGLTQDGVRFRLCDGGSVYSLSSDALLELMGEDAEALLPLTYLADYLGSYTALLNRTLTDASYQQELSQTVIELFVSACGGTVEEITVELDGAEVPAQRVQLELTPEALLNLLDGFASCGVTEVEDMLNSYMQLLSSATGMYYASLSDFTAEQRELLMEEDAISFPMELTWTTEGPAHAEIAMDFNVDETSALQLSFSETYTDEETSLDMILSFATDDGMGNTNQMDFHMTEQVDGPLNAPENVELHIEATSQNDWKSEYSEEGVEAVVHSYVSSSAMNLALDVNAAVVDGLEHATIDLGGIQRSSYTYDGDVNTDESVLSAHISSDERSEADGSVTTAVAMDIDVDGETVQLSWELNRAEGAPVPSFDESKTVDLAEILREDEDSAASIAMMSDALKLSADATSLCADESVLAMLELLDIDPDAMLDDGTVSEEIDYEDDDTATVYSMDEAAEIYAGVLPAFTLPEGLELDEIYVSEAYLDAYYSSPDGERYLDLSCFDYGYSHGEFFVLEDGALVPAGAVVNIDALDEENTAFSADVGVPTGMCSFSFYGFAREEVETFLASLQF